VVKWGFYQGRSDTKSDTNKDTGKDTDKDTGKAQTRNTRREDWNKKRARADALGGTALRPEDEHGEPLPEDWFTKEDE
jgi:hypothetical protein